MAGDGINQGQPSRIVVLPPLILRGGMYFIDEVVPPSLQAGIAGSGRASRFWFLFQPNNRENDSHLADLGYS